MLDRVRRHPQAVDLALAGLLSLAAVPDLLTPFDAPRASWGPLLDVAAALPLVWRRRFPVAVFALLLLLAGAQVLTQVPSRGLFAFLLAIYTLGAHVHDRFVLGAAASASVPVAAVGVVHWAPPGHEAAAFVLLTGTVAAALVLGVYARTRRAYLMSLVDRAATAERERGQAAELAVGIERARIAREMHDIVAHSLAVMISLNQGALFSLRAAPDDAQDALKEAVVLGRQTMAEMRRLVGVLRDRPDEELAPQPGLSALDDLLARIRAAGLPVELVVTGRPSQVPASAQLAIYRIVQEALTNVLKHAHEATRARVGLGFDGAAVDIEIRDDGVHAGAAAGASQGHGMTGMRERAAVFDGTVHAGPVAGRGWQVHVRLELAQHGPDR